MTKRSQKFGSTQTGIVLVSSLLLLLIVTIMALSIFRSFGIQEKIAGNTRDKQRALQAATSAQQYAEDWLGSTSGATTALSTGYAASADTACSAVVNSTLGAGQICSNTMASLSITPTSVPWSVGVNYSPPRMNVGSVTYNGTTDSYDVYYDTPRFYITDLGPVGANTEMYKIDAYAYGVSPNTVAVVESTFKVTCIVCGPGGL